MYLLWIDYHMELHLDGKLNLRTWQLFDRLLKDVPEHIYIRFMDIVHDI